MEKITTIPSVAMGENTYVVANNKNQCIIIDPGEKNLLDHDEIKEKEILAILLTHGHFDHIEGIIDLIEEKAIPVYIHQADEEMLYNSSLNLSQMVGHPFTIKGDIHPFITEEPIEIGTFVFTPFYTPGHTKGSVCYQKGNNLFTGDTLFAMGYGRVDFPGGNQTQMKKSLQKILAFDEKMVVYPGHGEKSTIKQCREFLNDHRFFN